MYILLLHHIQWSIYSSVVYLDTTVQCFNMNTRYFLLNRMGTLWVDNVYFIKSNQFHQLSFLYWKAWSVSMTSMHGVPYIFWQTQPFRWNWVTFFPLSYGCSFFSVNITFNIKYLTTQICRKFTPQDSLPSSLRQSPQTVHSLLL